MKKTILTLVFTTLILSCLLANNGLPDMYVNVYVTNNSQPVDYATVSVAYLNVSNVAVYSKPALLEDPGRYHAGASFGGITNPAEFPSIKATVSVPGVSGLFSKTVPNPGGWGTTVNIYIDISRYKEGFGPGKPLWELNL